MATLLLVGTTGLVGTAVRQQALEDERVSQIIALARQPLEPAPKLQSHVVDFDDLTGDEPWWNVDAVICTLGTTRAKAGSKKAFRHVDYDYPLAIATHARAARTPTFVLNSALGASPRSPFFYSRIKGELEQTIQNCRFPSLTIVRPALIEGQRSEPRLVEQSAVRATKALARVLPPRWHTHPAARIATMLLESALTNRPGTQIIEPDAFTDWPGSPFP